MNIIVAVDENWGIGYEDELLFHIPEDMKHFKRLTENKVVIMGRRTLLSLPGSKCLKNRINLILSRNKDFQVSNGVLCSDLPQLLTYTACFKEDSVFVIGGQLVYEQLLDYCASAWITKVQASCRADAFFPNLDARPHWEERQASAVKEHNGLKYTFTEYVNLSRKA